jgi:hypothetical protein
MCCVAGLGLQALLCFSAWTNLKKICDTKNEDSLACIHGLRVFSMLWVVAGHTCMFSFPVSGELRCCIYWHASFLNIAENVRRI